MGLWDLLGGMFSTGGDDSGANLASMIADEAIPYVDPTSGAYLPDYGSLIRQGQLSLNGDETRAPIDFYSTFGQGQPYTLGADLNMGGSRTYTAPTYDVSMGEVTNTTPGTSTTGNEFNSRTPDFSAAARAVQAMGTSQPTAPRTGGLTNLTMPAGVTAEKIGQVSVPQAPLIAGPSASTDVLSFTPMTGGAPPPPPSSPSTGLSRLAPDFDPFAETRARLRQ